MISPYRALVAINQYLDNELTATKLDVVYSICFKKTLLDKIEKVVFIDMRFLSKENASAISEQVTQLKYPVVLVTLDRLPLFSLMGKWSAQCFSNFLLDAIHLETGLMTTHHPFVRDTGKILARWINEHRTLKSYVVVDALTFSQPTVSHKEESRGRPFSTDILNLILLYADSDYDIADILYYTCFRTQLMQTITHLVLLDVDRVLYENTRDSVRIAHQWGQINYPKHSGNWFYILKSRAHFFSATSLGFLHRLILEFPHVGIVLISNWRRNFSLLELRHIFGEHLFNHYIIDKTAPSSSDSRALEIANWLKQNPFQKFVIWDDVDDHLTLFFPKNFVKVNFMLGECEYERAKIVLGPISKV